MRNDPPIRRQYLEIKSEHQDAILLFRLGDFYEAFDEDARTLARELDITLTSKLMGKDLRVPLAGVPHQSLERHLATLISRGHRVAICEQTSRLPVKGKDGKKLIEREVVRVVTAGTIVEPNLLQSKVNNYLAAFYSDGLRAGIAYTDISTGEFAVTEIENKNALVELERIAPTEILLADNENEIKNDASQFVTLLPAKFFKLNQAKKILSKHFETNTLKPFGLENFPLATGAAAALIQYLKEKQPFAVEQLNRLKFYDSGNFMVLDNSCLRSLEILNGESGFSLLSIIDRTLTAMGGRLLRRWLRQPLLDVTEIFKRQEHIEWFAADQARREQIREILSDIKDLERLSGRAKSNLITPYELLTLGKSLEFIPQIRKILQQDTIKFGHILIHLPDCTDISEIIRISINEELNLRNEFVGVIKTGYSSDLDRLRETLLEGKNFLARLEKKERERTGIKSLRVGFNKVFGYYIEVTKSNLHLVPKDFIRKQTLIPAERFITLELKEHESLVVHAQERTIELESNLFRQICGEVGNARAKILLAAQTLAYLDVIISLADVADNFNYARPTVNDTSLLRIKNGRHPVVENILNENNKNFIANYSALGGNGAPQIALITGPNASGKSTYLRQIAQIIILAQIGSFVPADEAVIGICDRIFTRIGLYDRIGSGESTFVTEMIETAEILHHASPQSLILLDELGRGTSTYDGLAVARAVLEFIHNHPKLQSRTIFATHYHELAELENLLPKIENLYFTIEENDGELRFRFKLAKGAAEKSYGVFAAKLAGLPTPVVRRAEELLTEYEAETSSIKKSDFVELSETEKKIIEIDTDSLSPVEALMKIYELKNLIIIQHSSKPKKATG